MRDAEDRTGETCTLRIPQLLNARIAAQNHAGFDRP